MSRTTLLVCDGVINLALGVLLIWFPDGLTQFLGLPSAEPGFYRSILGAVLFGIGIALMVEARSRDRESTGLGLGGAIAINLCGGVALAAWLILGDLGLPMRGEIFLWGLVVILVGISGLELMRSRPG